MADKVRVTVKEKILIHLFGFSKYRDDFEVPQKVTQDGMAKVIGVRRSHIASALKDLKALEFVEEKKTRIEANDRRKNAYFLTPSGEIESVKIKDAVLEKEVSITLEDGTSKDVKISEIGKNIEKKMGLMEILSCISPKGVFAEKEEEKVEPEKTVVCPFCAHTNFNFEMNEVPISETESGVQVACIFCGREFLARDKQDPEDPGTFVALPPPPELPPMPPPPTGKPFLVSLGLFFMMGSFILALLVGLAEIPSEFCLLAPLGFIISLIIIYIGLKDVKHLEAMSRRLLVLTGTVFATFVALFVALTMGAEFDLERPLENPFHPISEASFLFLWGSFWFYLVFSFRFFPISFNGQCGSAPFGSLLDPLSCMYPMRCTGWIISLSQGPFVLVQGHSVPYSAL
jgi:DNA-binding transcriptional regulator GbsR (MarR family)